MVEKSFWGLQITQKIKIKFKKYVAFLSLWIIEKPQDLGYRKQSHRLTMKCGRNQMPRFSRIVFLNRRSRLEQVILSHWHRNHTRNPPALSDVIIPDRSAEFIEHKQSCWSAQMWAVDVGKYQTSELKENSGNRPRCLGKLRARLPFEMPTTNVGHPLDKYLSSIKSNAGQTSAESVGEQRSRCREKEQKWEDKWRNHCFA